MSKKIKDIKAKEILDSRENSTVEVELETDDGIFKASVPSGASKGKYEAVELRDDDKKGVSKAIKNVNEIIALKLKGKDPTEQEKIDNLMIELDGTDNKKKLGVNAILPVSIAVCRAGASAKNLPLYKYIYKIENCKLKIENWQIPLPCFNVINGGVHAGNNLDIQEFMIVPQEDSFSKNLQAGKDIYRVLAKSLGEETKIGDEGGFAPLISKTNQALDLLMEAIKDYSAVKFGLDCAATQFFKNGKYYLEGKDLTGQELNSFYQDLIDKYPIIFIEDPFAEEDWKSWKELDVLVVGDDLTVTSKKRLDRAVKENCISGIIVKPNQVGTITETLETIKIAKEAGLKIIVSHRSGETLDDFIADLAVGIRADFIKSGAPAPPERMTKYNRLYKIEKSLKNNKIIQE